MFNSNSFRRLYELNWHVGVVVTITATSPSGTTGSDGGDVVVVFTETEATSTNPAGGLSYVVEVRLSILLRTHDIMLNLVVDDYESSSHHICSWDTDCYTNSWNRRFATIWLGRRSTGPRGFRAAMVWVDRCAWDVDRRNGSLVRLTR